jgi:pantoate--beta-alanine ligase
MLKINTVNGLSNLVDIYRKTQKTIGFVPTMGALHDGHASLMKQSLQENDITIVSVFVNPKQFNNADDLNKYPRTIDADLLFLKKTGVDVVFVPNSDEVYSPEYIAPKIDLGRLELLMEGKMRPGHFDGVVQVLARFFQIIKPTNAYFGLKDFQQVAVVRKMVELLSFQTTIVSCPIYRELNGLAYSSRNERLSMAQKEEALFIHQSLLKAKEYAINNTPKEVVALIEQSYKKSTLELEYFEVVHPITLESLNNTWVQGAVGCIVAFVGDVRLIDNMLLKT